MKKITILVLSIAVVNMSVLPFVFGNNLKAESVENREQYTDNYFKSNAHIFEKYISYNKNSLSYSVDKRAEKELGS